MLNTGTNSAMAEFSALVDFSKLINSSLDLSLSLNNILLTSLSKFHTTRGLIALTDKNSQLIVKASKGFTPQLLEQFPKVSIHQCSDHEAFAAFMQNTRTVVCREISFSGENRGVIILGSRLGGNEYTNSDLEFLDTLLNLGASAIENSLNFEEMKRLNKDLDTRINQLSSLFDLGKEFSGILEVSTVTRLLTFSIIGQLLVSKYAIITFGQDGYNVLDTKIQADLLENWLGRIKPEDITGPLSIDSAGIDLPEKVELVIPMQIKGETKGIILLGKRINGKEFSRTDIEFAYSVGSLAIISIENSRLFQEALEKQRLEKDLEIARNIQQNLLPKKLPRMKKFEIASYNKSARQVGGDYFDVIKLDSARTLIAIADVSGKGVQAALLMANLQAFLKSMCKKFGEISEATGLINDLVTENIIIGSFITFFWGILDEENSTFTYVNAGHNPPLLLREGTITKLKLGGMILGIIPTMAPYALETVELKPGDALLLFTDGVTEAMSAGGVEYSDERLEELLINYSPNSTSSELIEKIKSDIELFTRGAVQSDDITMLAMKAL